MKKYTLEVIMNVSQKLKTYEVIADYFDWSESGCYVFYTRCEHRNTIVSTYPISRTIINKIEINKITDTFEKLIVNSKPKAQGVNNPFYSNGPF